MISSRETGISGKEIFMKTMSRTFTALSQGLILLAAAAGCDRPKGTVKDIDDLRVEYCVDMANRTTSDYNQLHHAKVRNCLNQNGMGFVPPHKRPSYAQY
jgi:hypothetical protein